MMEAAGDDGSPLLSSCSWSWVSLRWRPWPCSGTRTPRSGRFAGVDHWHDAYLINRCGVDLPLSVSDDHGDGNHSHQDGLIHIHPSSPAGAGVNATFGNFVEAMGAELSDEAYVPGPGESPGVLSEEEGCDGEPALLQLAYWEDAFGDEPPVIVTENLADFRLEHESLGAITLALLPEGADVPKPPQDRLDALVGSDSRPG